MARRLTQRRGEDARARILLYVSRRWANGQNAPTIRELAREVGLSLATVHRHVAILVEQGLLTGKGRALRPSGH